MKRSPMKRGTKPMRRSKPLGAGKKTKAKRAALLEAAEIYFLKAGCVCQLSGQESDCLIPHHKTPRSEMRKAGVPDLDAPARIIFITPAAHRWVHAGQMGRPKEGQAAERFAEVERSEANAANGQQVKLSAQTALDLERYLKEEGRG